ncbi:MAG: hypothetical protein WBW31_23745 [Candidatus Sulfotelmatobacter sp.]
MFENKRDEQLEALKAQVAEMIELEKALLRKLEFQMAALDTLSKFVRENSAGTAAFARTR